jgi:hypothetical protein
LAYSLLGSRHSAPPVAPAGGIDAEGGSFMAGLRSVAPIAVVGTILVASAWAVAAPPAQDPGDRRGNHGAGGQDQREIDQVRREIRRCQGASADLGADLDRLSRLVLRWHRLRKSGTQTSAVNALRQRIATNLRRGGLHHAQRNRRGQGRVLERARVLLMHKRAVAGDLVLLQRELDAGASDLRTLAERQELLLLRYWELSREEIALGVLEPL